MFDDIILDIIKEIELSKEVQNKFPEHALFMEIKDLVILKTKESLKKLSLQKRIKWGNTINDKYFKSIT